MRALLPGDLPGATATLPRQAGGATAELLERSATLADVLVNVGSALLLAIGAVYLARGAYLWVAHADLPPKRERGKALIRFSLGGMAVVAALRVGLALADWQSWSF